MISRYIINPKNKYKIAWDMVLACFYLFSYWLDPFIFAFRFRPLLNVHVSRFVTFVTLILVFDMVVTLFTGVRKEDEITILK